jgi:hypothetical protein
VYGVHLRRTKGTTDGGKEMRTLGEKAHSDLEIGSGADRRALLSLAWIFVTVNYIYCDVIGLMEPAVLREFLDGSIGGIEITRGFLFGASVLMEIPMAMIVLARVLRNRPNRVANIVAGTVMTIVQVISLFVGDPPAPHYLFFSAVEIATTAFVVWYAWTWPRTESSIGVDRS